MNLHEWLILYIKHKDVFEQSLLGFTEEGDRVLFTFKEHTLTGYVWESLSIPDSEGKTFIATLQTEENVNFLINNWDEFITHKDLTLAFVNTETNEKWLLRPAAHHRASDAGVQQSIGAIASSIPYLTA